MQNLMHLRGREDRHETTESKKTGVEKKEIKLNAVLLEAEEGGFVSMNPETGICSQGDSVEEAVVNLRDATELYIEECPDECPQEALSEAIIKTMKVAVDEDALADGA